MPTISPAALLRELETPAPGGCFFLSGDEEYLREEATDRIVAAHLEAATRDFNLDQVRGGDVTPEAIASLLATPPMMADWRVVVVREAQGLSAKAREAVEAVVDAPPPGLVLVLSAAIPTGSRAKFYSVLQKACRSTEFPRIDPMDAPGWLMERASEEHALDMSADAARALVAAMGTHLGALRGELAKLASFVQDRREVTLDDVRAVSGSIPRYDRWAWFDLIGERKLEEAFRQLPGLLESGESGVGLVIGMTTQLLRIGLVCAGGQGALEQELRSHQRWLARRITPQARRWTLDEVHAALAELLRTDRLLKSAPLTERQTMEELLLRLHALGARQGRAA